MPWSRRVCAHGLKAIDVTRKALVRTCAAPFTPHTQRALLLTTLVEAGLVIAAGVVLLAGQWDSLSLMIRVVIGISATGVLAANALEGEESSAMPDQSLL